MKLKEINHLCSDFNKDTSVIPHNPTYFDDSSIGEDVLSDNVYFEVFKRYQRSFRIT